MASIFKIAEKIGATPYKNPEGEIIPNAMFLRCQIKGETEARNVIIQRGSRKENITFSTWAGRVPCSLTVSALTNALNHRLDAKVKSVSVSDGEADIVVSSSQPEGWLARRGKDRITREVDSIIVTGRLVEKVVDRYREELETLDGSFQEQNRRVDALVRNHLKTNF